MSDFSSLFPARLDWPGAIDDVADLDPNNSYALLRGKVKNCDLLTQRNNLSCLWWIDVDENALKILAKCSQLKALYLENIRVSPTMALKAMPQLELLSIEGCSKLKDLIGIGQLRNLQRLAIIDCKNIHNLIPLANLSQLRELALAGGVATRMRVNSFTPIAKLQHLEFLHLTNIKTDDDSLAPLSNLDNLKQLDSANYYPMAEYARLSQQLPQVRCTWFEPYINFGHDVCTRCNRADLVILTGIRKPQLCKFCDTKRLEKHVAEWNAARRAR